MAGATRSTGSAGSSRRTARAATPTDGVCGSTPGRRVCASPLIRKALRRLDDRWRAALADTIRDGVESGEFECADPTATLARVGALYDGLSVAVLVYENVTRAELRTWMRDALAAELGIDPSRLV